MTSSTRSIRRACVLLVALLVVAIAAPSAALAQNVEPTDEEYGAGVIGAASEGEDSGGGNDPVAADASAEVAADSGISELPFTGLDVAAIAAIGLGLVGAGVAIRRASRSGDNPI